MSWCFGVLFWRIHIIMMAYVARMDSDSTQWTGMVCILVFTIIRLNWTPIRLDGLEHVTDGSDIKKPAKQAHAGMHYNCVA